MVINEFVEAAIIGHWRMGASDEQIADVTGIFYVEDVTDIINDYKKKLENQLNSDVSEKIL